MSSELQPFLDFLSRATPVVLVLAGFLGFYFREKLRQALARSLLADIEEKKADFAKDLASHSAQLQRDMEAYKVSLIAEAERAKAQQDVRKSVALKIAERKFTSVAALLDAHTGFDTALAAHLAMVIDPAIEPQRAIFIKSTSDLLELYGRYDAALNMSNPFLSLETRRVGVEFRRLATGMFGERVAPESAPVPTSDARVITMLTLASELERLLRDTMHELEGIDV